MTLTELKELAQKATPGPWVLDGIDQDEPHIISTIISKGLYSPHPHVASCPMQWKDHYKHLNNAAFIAAANPHVVLQLIERIEKLTLAVKGEWSELQVEHEAEFREFLSKYGAQVGLE